MTLALIALFVGFVCLFIAIRSARSTSSSARQAEAAAARARAAHREAVGNLNEVLRWNLRR